jgi:hypothetical protein
MPITIRPVSTIEFIFLSETNTIGYYDAILETVENPDLVLRGYRGTLIAVRSHGRRRYFMVVYRQVSADDGFIITAYFTSKLDRRHVVWRKP